MNTSSTSAPSASSNNKLMAFPFKSATVFGRSRPSGRLTSIIATAALLASCANVPRPPLGGGGALVPPLPSSAQAKSRWVAAPWSELPGFEQDSLPEAWNAWLKSCEHPGPVFAPLCSEVRRLSIASAPEQRAWMQERLQPYRIESQQGVSEGLLTSYYEPVLKASRRQEAGYGVPLYRLPATLASRKPWFSRQEIDTLPEAGEALKGREIAWVADPIDALMLHIQGSGRLLLSEADGSNRAVRLAFAGSNDQPYRSVNQWLLSQGVTKINPWPDATKAWVAANPQRVQELLWSNPRYIFFREETVSDFEAGLGPKGAQGVALTPGRSIAVDPASIPYGTPVWLASRGSAASLEKLVLAQDTGSAIVGAVRADYFAGTGAQAGQLAARFNQPLRLWALWPK